jgi:DNA-binding transcriptional regulator WhiA
LSNSRNFEGKEYKEGAKGLTENDAKFKKKILKSVGINARVIQKKDGYSVYIRPMEKNIKLISI